MRWSWKPSAGEPRNSPLIATDADIRVAYRLFGMTKRNNTERESSR